jgi:sensor c-di-GMP phosphodiesterase-like protein
MQIMKQRAVLALSVTAVAALAGALCGYLIARQITIRVIKGRLDRYAMRIVADGEASGAELRTVLAAVVASQNKPCSEGEIGYFRALIFESEYLKDAGRMHDGRIVCSAAMGRRGGAQFSGTLPDFTQQDGTLIFRDLAPYRNSGIATLAIQSGDSFVVYRPLMRMHLESAPMHVTETVMDAATQRSGSLLGEPPEINGAMLTTEGSVRVGESMYATQCSTRFFYCVTAYTSIPEVVQANRMRFLGCVALSSLGGGFFGLILSLLYQRNMSMEHQLRRALRDNRLAVFYQPLVSLATRQIIGAEALVRWTDDTGTSVSPEVFVRLAEDRGFVGEITELVIRHVLRDFGSVLRSGLNFRISINIAASDLTDGGFLPRLEQALTCASVCPQSVVIEITEGSTANSKEAIDAILQLRRRGHRVHIDDFGTGYSSLAYLHELSVDAIKIDRAFTQAVGTGAATAAIVPQILAMAAALNLAVIVEGVETEMQAQYFTECGQPVVAQGWLFGPAVPFAKFRDLIASTATMIPRDVAVVGPGCKNSEKEQEVVAACVP